jgi:hypothetical protein
MTIAEATQIKDIYSRTVIQHPEWPPRQLLECVCYRCYATHDLVLEHEDVMRALDMTAAVSDATVPSPSLPPP